MMFYYLCGRVRQSRKWELKMTNARVNRVNHAIQFLPICMHMHWRFFEQFHFLFGIRNKHCSPNCVVTGSLLICFFFDLNFVTYGWNVTLNFCLLHIKAFKVFFNLQIFCSSFRFRLFLLRGVKCEITSFLIIFLMVLQIECDRWRRRIGCECPRNLEKTAMWRHSWLEQKIQPRYYLWYIS